MALFDEAVSYVLENEGVDSDHPAHRGGRPRYGITHAVAHASGYDVTTLTREQAKDIYRRFYWHAGFDSVPRRVAIKLFDMAVNFGAAGAARVAQKATGVTIDGNFGPQTFRAINLREETQMVDLLARHCAYRYMDIIAAHPEQIAFVKGWVRRAFKV